jgi:membrane protein
MAILLGAEFNAETERARRLESGATRADEAIGLEERMPASSH